MQQPPSNPPIINHYVRALAIAKEEALRFRHLRIHPEHILLGLIQVEGSITETALAALDVTAQMTRKVMSETISEFEKVSDETLARNELTTWNINLDEVLRVIRDVTPKTGKVAPMKYSPEMNSTSITLMSLANEMVWRQSSKYFCTEHVILSLFLLHDSGAKVFLESLGLSQVKVQQTLETMRADTQEFKDMNEESSY